MSSKRTWFVSLFLVFVLLVGVASAAPPAQEELTYTVKLGDNLWTLAEKYLGSGAAFPAIAGNTNKRATEDDTFAYISNPDLIHPGWKLLIPSAEVAAEYMATYAPKPVAGAPTEITLVDANSGANFQLYWQETVIPQIQADLGIKVNYLVSSESEQLERMKAWEAGQGDVHLLFVKPETVPNALEQGIELETMYPDRLDIIPNLGKCPRNYLMEVLGENIDGKGALYWRSQYALIYNSEYITDPPTSWKEFYDRRAEWKGHIGIVRPDAKSGSSYRIPYSFLNAFVAMADENDKAIPLEELEQTAEWQDAWAKLQDFYTYAKLPLPAEPPNMFEDFNAGDTWISFYAMDYALWSRSQGTMPPTIKSSFLAEGMAAGSDGYLIVPVDIPEEYKPVVYRLINRHGSTREPQWRGGGVAHGPRPRSYYQKMPRKMRRLAYKSALSVKAKERQIIILDDLQMLAPKTREITSILEALAVDSSALILLPEKNDNVEKSAGNLPNVKTLRAHYLNVRDLLGYDYLLMPLEALEVIETILE